MMPAALRLCVQVKRGLPVVYELALRVGKLALWMPGTTALTWYIWQYSATLRH
jgi:hypothetical protein